MIQNNVTVFVILILAALVGTIALVVYLFTRLRALESESEMLIRDTEGHNIVELVNNSMLQVESMGREVDALVEKNDWMVKRLAGAVRNVGMVRFDAFRGLGGRMSFSVALLDDRGNGVVISSIYGRSESRIYTKPVIERGSKYELSPEEREAIRLATLNKELGALPEESVDREYQDRMENLRLFHDKEISDYVRDETYTNERRAQSPRAREQASGERIATGAPRARESRVASEKGEPNGAVIERPQRKAPRRAPVRRQQRPRPRRPEGQAEETRDRDSEGS